MIHHLAERRHWGALSRFQWTLPVARSFVPERFRRYLSLAFDITAAEELPHGTT